MTSQRVLSLLIIVAAFGGLFDTASNAAQVVLTPSKDNTLYDGVGGGRSNGAGTGCFAGNNGGGSSRRAVMAFDIAGNVPAGATINSVSLTLNVTQTQGGTQSVTLHRLIADWGESTSVASGGGGGGGGGGPAATGDATWLHTFFNTDFWSSPGGDFDAAGSAFTAVGGNGAYTWASTARMVSDVQFWLDNPGSDFGWIVVGNEAGAATAKRFATREHPATGLRPQLTIDYTSGGPDGACCDGVGTCTVLTSADCALAGNTYQGDGTNCTINPCVQPTGACCANAGTCSVDSAAKCASSGGSYQGDGTACAVGLCPVVLEKYVDALPIPGVLQPVTGTAGGAADYRIAMTEFDQQLHRDLPPTRLWGYGGSYPGPTIEATTGEQVTVEWFNDLRDEFGVLRTEHYLPVDTCASGPDTEGNNPRVVVHLHGAHVPEDSDGYPLSTFLPGESALYTYPNDQLPATLWYHDHAMGITRLNVYMGLAAFYIIRDAVELGLGLPDGEFEIPIAIQDRAFNPDGTLQYPANLGDFFFGDTMVVNGKAWPFLEVKQGKYRLRLLNGCNSRVLTLAMSSGDSFIQIGTDGGLLPEPVVVNEITLSGAERADVIVDFSAFAPGTEIILTNSAPAPYPGIPGVGVIPEIMKFIVTGTPGFTGPVPTALRPIEVLQEADATVTRDFVLSKTTEPCAGAMWTINGLGFSDITEFPELGATEVWRFINRSGLAHPMHMHLVMFQVLDRQDFVMNGGEVTPVGQPVIPDPNEQGWKDTVKVDPFEIVRVIARFEDYPGKYAYHCHILEHEDHEMMRQFQVVDPQPPASVPALSQWGLVVFALGLMVVARGIMAHRRGQCHSTESSA
jgi:FtsP/CotA-like multicopper oxidase with cupredoxin domain